ncbi:hypothetical protein Lo5R7ANS_10 [Mesorhizobium phage vB_MloP_Lo5R7ANS]|uniref:Uncharacterized protein n=1 Tax=Mesorhizobium phage vB_MloP_Lo5R7ANS TaxID=1527771 RepID=A0A076YM45_9CAUD|nr:hypothetical protein Lo5R7ANS_10 [Mesorhizobium phage vB_MloP_Lo5R7ANS]AIK68480.1 hypothetical protein Lo5R7ANS_10 [Mesorhizobium phage vB_MloP_Lo5R7ANS]
MMQQQFEAILVQLTRIANALETNGLGAAPGVSAEVPTNPYASSDVPEGYDTVLGYFSKNMPGAFELMDDPITGTLRDGHWLTHQANRRGLGIIKVPAPEPLIEIGINELNAYPVSLLQERIR